MRKAKLYSVKEVFDNTDFDLTYEFFSSKHTPFIVEQLSDIIGKNVILTGDSNYHPSMLNAILLKEYNGEKPRYQLKVGFRPYGQLNPYHNLVLMWINEYATLDFSTILKAKMSFNHKNLQTLSNISNMNVGKMLLKMDENFMHKRFPDAINSPFSMSIKKLVPVGNFINASDVIRNLENLFQMPMNEYYGIDFTKYTHGNLTFNYICGEYASKPDQILEALEYFMLSTYQTLNETDYSPAEINELHLLTENYLSLRNLYYNSDKFLEAYKDIKVMSDLDSHPSVIKSKWHLLRDPLFRVMFESGFKKGKFNWDSDQGTFQIKNATLSGITISNFDLVDCNLDGCVLENIHAWGSKIENSRMIIGTLVMKNKIIESYIENIRADRNNSINNSFIRNNGEIINCKVENTIIFKAGIGSNAKLDENCTLIESRDFRSIPKEGIKQEKIRDYKWIKSLSGDKKDAGWGNEYKTDY